MVHTGEIHPFGEGMPSLGRMAQRQLEAEPRKGRLADHMQTVTLEPN